MRNRILVTTVLMVAVGGGCAESVANSPECERWVADYRQKLAESRPVQAVERQNSRVKHYVHRQIAVLTRKPQLVRTASSRDPLHPRISPQQMVKRFQVLCGDLPPIHTGHLIPPVPTPAPPPTAMALTGPVDSPFTPAGPAPMGPSTPGTSGAPPTPEGNTPPSPPVTPGGGGTIPAPPAPPVPEPSSLALMVVGGLAGAGWLWSRRREPAYV